MLGAISLWIQSLCYSADIHFIKLQLSSTQSQFLNKLMLSMHCNTVDTRWTQRYAISRWIQSRRNSFHSRCILNAKVADIATTFNTVTISETNSRWACNTVNVNTTMFHIEYNFDAILSIPVAFWMQCNWSHKYSHYKNSCFLLKLPKLWLQ